MTNSKFTTLIPIIIILLIVTVLVGSVAIIENIGNSYVNTTVIYNDTPVKVIDRQKDLYLLENNVKVSLKYVKENQYNSNKY